MLQLILQKLILAMAATNPPLLFSQLYKLDWYSGILREWIAGLDLTPEAKILELGCGPGNLSADLANMNFQVIGADKSARMIAHASKLQTNARFIQADALNLPMKDNEFDAVLLASLINLVPDRALLLKEIARVLKPGGTISVLFPTPAFNRNTALQYANKHQLGQRSRAALCVWASVAKQLDAEDIAQNSLPLVSKKYPQASTLKTISPQLKQLNNLAIQWRFAFKLILKPFPCMLRISFYPYQMGQPVVDFRHTVKQKENQNDEETYPHHSPGPGNYRHTADGFCCFSFSQVSDGWRRCHVAHHEYH